MPISRDEVSCTVIARNVHIDTEQQDVIDYFSFCGEVERVEFRKDQNSTTTKTALIVFDEERSVDASSVLENAEIDGNALRIFSYAQFLENKKKKRRQQQQQQEQNASLTGQQQEGQYGINETVEVTKERLKNYYNQAKEHETVKNTLSFMKQGWSTITGEASKLVRENQDLPERIKRTTSRSSPSRGRRNHHSASSSTARASSSARDSPLMELGEPPQSIKDRSTPSTSDGHALSQSQNNEPLLDFGSSTPQNVDQEEQGANNEQQEPDLLDIWDSTSSQPQSQTPSQNISDQQNTSHELLFSDLTNNSGTSSPQQQNNQNDVINHEFDNMPNVTQSEHSVNDNILSFDDAEPHSQSIQRTEESAQDSTDHLVDVGETVPKNDPPKRDNTAELLWNSEERIQNNQKIPSRNVDNNLISFGANEEPTNENDTPNINANNFEDNDNDSDIDHDNNLLKPDTNIKPTMPSSDTLQTTVDTDDLFGEFRPTQPSVEPNQEHTPTDDPLGSFFTPDAEKPTSSAKQNQPVEPSSGDLADEIFGGSQHQSTNNNNQSSALNMLELDNINDNNQNDPFQPPTLETDDLSSGSQKDVLDPDELFGMMSSSSGSGYSTDSVDLPIQSGKHHADDNLLSGMDSEFSNFTLDDGLSKRTSFLDLSDQLQTLVLQYASESGFSIMMLSLVCKQFYRVIKKMGDKLWQRACITQLGINSIAPGTESWRHTYRAAFSVYRIPNLVSHIRAQVHPNLENTILGLPVELGVPKFDLIIPKEYFEAIMYGHHPDQKYQSAIFVNMNNDTICLVRRCPHLEASLLRISQLPNGDYRVFEGGVRAEMAGGLPADALASDAWLFSNEAWERIQMCYETNSQDSDFYVAQHISVTSKTVQELEYGLKVSLKEGQEVNVKANKKNLTLTAYVPPALTDEAAENLYNSIFNSAKKAGLPVVAMPCGLEDLPSQTLLRTLCTMLSRPNARHLRKVVICCPSESVCRSIVGTFTSTMESKQINQVDIMMP